VAEGGSWSTTTPFAGESRCTVRETVSSCTLCPFIQLMPNNTSMPWPSETDSEQFSYEVERSMHNQLLGDNPSSRSTNHVRCVGRFNCQSISLSSCLADEIMGGSSIK
jgi:hypothetical protein